MEEINNLHIEVEVEVEDVTEAEAEVEDVTEAEAEAEVEDIKVPNYIKHKKSLVKYIMDKINNSKTPPHIWLLIIKSLHISTPGFALIIFLLGSFELSVVVCIILQLTLSLFIYFNGCFLTTIENKLEKNSTNIIDPYIYILGDIPDNHNRNYYTLQLCGFFFGITGVIFYVRHNDYVKLNYF